MLSDANILTCFDGLGFGDYECDTAIVAAQELAKKGSPTLILKALMIAHLNGGFDAFNVIRNKISAEKQDLKSSKRSIYRTITPYTD